MSIEEYYASVQDMAEDIVSGCRDGTITDIHSAVHEAVDSSHWVIYGDASRKVLLYSGNETAGPDEMGWDGFAHGVRSFSELFTRGAYYAMMADVIERLDDIDGFDPNDEDSWMEDDEDSDEDSDEDDGEE
jgi:restriction endonuclease Mrr